MAYSNLGSKKFTSVHDRLATEMNKCIQKVYIPETPSKELPPKKLQTHNVPTDDVEKTNGTN